MIIYTAPEETRMPAMEAYADDNGHVLVDGKSFTGSGLQPLCGCSARACQTARAAARKAADEILTRANGR